MMGHMFNMLEFCRLCGFGKSVIDDEMFVCSSVQGKKGDRLFQTKGKSK